VGYSGELTTSLQLYTFLLSFYSIEKKQKMNQIDN